MLKVSCEPCDVAFSASWKLSCVPRQTAAVPETEMKMDRILLQCIKSMRGEGMRKGWGGVEGCCR